ncbi:MAG: hypothetical protein AAGG07_06010 [Planctomycetota bacterium]
MHSVEADYTQSYRQSTGVTLDAAEVAAGDDGYDASGRLVYSRGRIMETRSSSADSLPSTFAYDGSQRQFRTGTEENWVAVSQSDQTLKPFLNPDLAVFGQYGAKELLDPPPMVELAGVELSRNSNGDPVVRVLSTMDASSLPADNPAELPNVSIDREFFVNLRTGIIEQIRVTAGDVVVGSYEALEIESVDVDGNEVFFITSSREVQRQFSGAVQYVYDIAIDRDSIKVNETYDYSEFNVGVTPEDTVYAVDIDTFLQDSRRVAAIRDLDEALSMMSVEEAPRQPPVEATAIESRPVPVTTPIQDDQGASGQAGRGIMLPVLLAGLGLLGIGALVMVMGKKR